MWVRSWCDQIKQNTVVLCMFKIFPPWRLFQEFVTTFLASNHQEPRESRSMAPLYQPWATHNHPQEGLYNTRHIITCAEESWHAISVVDKVLAAVASLFRQVLKTRFPTDSKHYRISWKQWQHMTIWFPLAPCNAIGLCRTWGLRFWNFPCPRKVFATRNTKLKFKPDIEKKT